MSKKDKQLKICLRKKSMSKKEKQTNLSKKEKLLKYV